MADKKVEKGNKARKAEKGGAKKIKKPEVKKEKRRDAVKKKIGEVKKVEKKGQQASEVKVEKPAAVSKEQQLKGLEIIKYPLITEKAVNMIETENKMVFIVAKSANKQMVKEAVESLYGIKVDSVNIMKDTKSRKKALVKINTKFKAEDLATKLGVL
ncbi:MAG: 50S ribosomal protein L23 [Candidatus Diapherotrites archaeon]